MLLDLFTKYTVTITPTLKDYLNQVCQSLSMSVFNNFFMLLLLLSFSPITGWVANVRHQPLADMH